jgi:hypothetical protein
MQLLAHVDSILPTLPTPMSTVHVLLTLISSPQFSSAQVDIAYLTLVEKDHLVLDRKGSPGCLRTGTEGPSTWFRTRWAKISPDFVNFNFFSLHFFYCFGISIITVICIV